MVYLGIAEYEVEFPLVWLCILVLSFYVRVVPAEIAVYFGGVSYLHIFFCHFIIAVGK